MPMPAPAVMAAAKTAPAWGAAAIGGLKAFGGWLGKNQGLVSLGSSLLGGLGGSGDPYSTHEYKRGRRHQRADAEWYRDNISGVKAIVDDAKRAGVHPLLALGGGSNAGQVISSQPQSGSRSQDALRTIASYAGGRQAQQDRVDLVQAQAQASAMRIAEHLVQNDVDTVDVQKKVSRNPNGLDRHPPVSKATPAAKALTEVLPNVVKSRDPEKSDTAAGTNPAWIKLEVLPGLELEFLGEDVAETFESPVLFLAFVERNKDKITVPFLRYLHQKLPSTVAGKYALRALKLVKSPSGKTADPFIGYSRGPHR